MSLVKRVERADTHWGWVLQGRRGQAGGSLVYRWPDSPMRIAAEVDPDAEEGPIAVEFAAARTVGLPRTPHPVLGPVFRRGTA